MYVMVYFFNGMRRVAPYQLVAETWSEAKYLAANYSIVLGRNVAILDVTELVRTAEDRMDWRDKGWYCQHSYEFCTPCFAGYDHPADEAADRMTHEADDYASFDSQMSPEM